MVFFILILSVFIAELIIFIYMMVSLFKANKKVVETNCFLSDAKPKIEQIAALGTKISEQLSELAPIAEKKVKEKFLDFGINYFKGILVTLSLLAIKKKFNLKILH